MSPFNNNRSVRMVRKQLLWSVCAALVAAACSDANTPTVPHPLFSFSPNGITQSRPANGALNEPGTRLAKGSGWDRRRSIP